MSEQSIKDISNIIFLVLTKVMKKPVHTFIIANIEEDTISYLKSLIEGEFTEEKFLKLLKNNFEIHSLGNKSVELIPKSM